MKFLRTLSSLAVVGALAFSANANAVKPDWADSPYPDSICDEISWATFVAAANAAYASTETYGLQAGGFEVGMWATLMDHTGSVCYVYSVDDGGANGGADAGDTAWLGSRVISIQKANTANAFSLDTISLPTGSITPAVYEGGSLYGLQFSNPVNAEQAYKGNITLYGTEDDPAVGERIGGVNVFGGGIALYDGEKRGAVGVSGDTSCRDHSMAYNLRHELGLDVGIPNPDELELVDPPTALFQQPTCGAGEANGFGIAGSGFANAP